MRVPTDSLECLIAAASNRPAFGRFCQGRTFVLLAPNGLLWVESRRQLPAHPRPFSSAFTDLKSCRSFSVTSSAKIKQHLDRSTKAVRPDAIAAIRLEHVKKRTHLSSELG
jgi:hypothetical protein